MTQRPETVLADAGYWDTRQMENIVSDGIQVLVPLDAGLREGARPGSDKGPYAFMRRVLSSEAGHELYKHRKATVERVFAQNEFSTDVIHCVTSVNSQRDPKRFVRALGSEPKARSADSSRSPTRVRCNPSHTT